MQDFIFDHFLARMNKALDKDTCEIIVRRTIANRSEAKLGLRRKFDHFINNSVSIKGFRNATAAPTTLLENEIVKRTGDSHFLHIIVLSWIDFWPEASKIAESLLIVHLPELIDLAELKDEEGAAEKINDFIALAVDQLTNKVNCSPAESVALICAMALEELSGAIVEVDIAEPEKQENKLEEEKTDDGGFIWDRFLREAERIPAESPEWGRVGQFITSLQELAEEKASHNTSLIQLGEALNKLYHENKNDLSYFKLEGTAQWDKDRAPVEKAGWLVEQINDLGRIMKQYRDIENTPSTTVDDARRQRERLTRLEQTIEDRFGEIKAVLETPTVPEGRLVETAPEPESGNRIEVAPTGDAEAGADNVDRSDVPTKTEDTYIGDPDLESSDDGNDKTYTPTRAEKHGGKNKKSSIPVVEVKNDEERYWRDYCWELLKEDDLAGAYWLCVSLEAQGRNSPVPGWLLEAVQGARWLAMDSGHLVDDLARIARDRFPGGSDVEGLLGLAASLRPAVIAPAAGMLDWVKAPDCFLASNGLVQAIKKFAHYGKALHGSDLRILEGVEQYEEDIKLVVDNTRQWLHEAPRRRTKLARATNVWIDLVRSEDGLKGFLHLVANDCRDRLSLVQEKVLPWSDRTYVENRIAEIDRKLIGRRVPAIIGAPRDQILRYVRDACELAGCWCEFVSREKESRGEGGDWFARLISKLRGGVQAELEGVREEILLMQDGAKDPGQAAAALCLLRVLEQFCGDLNIDVQPIVSPGKGWSWLPDSADSIGFALAKRLLLLPETKLDNWGRPTELANIADALRIAEAQEKSLEDIILQWLGKKDFRFVQFLISTVDSEDKKAELDGLYEQKLSESVSLLEDMLHKVNSEIEQAVVDGVLSDEERSSLLSELQNIDLKVFLDHCEQQAKMEQVRQSLFDARRQKLDQLKRDWVSIQERLPQYPGDEKVKVEITAAVINALERGDSRVIEECIAQLNELMDLGDPLKENPFSLPTDGDWRESFRRFIGLSAKLEELLGYQTLKGLQNAVKNGKPWSKLRFNLFPRPLEDEVTRAIDSWRWLKQGSAKNRTNADHIDLILRYLGFNVETALSGVNIQKIGEHWLYLQVEMSTGGRAPIPQFGSQQQNIFDVVCLWERPSVDTLTSWMKDLHLQSRNILVIYLGRMSIRQRNVMRQVTADRGLTIAVLDEILFAYLSAERLGRLQPFFRCTLPFAAVNPYTPFRAGDVPPEMFFGRRDMAREIQRAEGSCIVYGGRQLGKSALLRHVQREFHSPEREQYAFVEDIKLVGSSSSEIRPQAIWTKIRDIYKGLGLMPVKEKSENPERITKLIENIMQNKPNCRVLVLFDEADNFLDADSDNGFTVVEGLRVLMSKTERRFKVVLAGLHNVQRFQGRSNQPLAHFGTPICVGPLEPDAAQRLIREPLETLGFFFPDSSVILSILSYTNYHPGLIQLFCQELLNSMDIPQGQDPPYSLSRDDVESVYRKTEVRARICERFDWTLALDRRYQAIAWTMILDQTHHKNGFSQTYTAGEILTLVREWWPQGFEGIESDQLRGLLEEMCGLGVLVRGNQGHYRLRSPNLVRLMEDVGDRLLDLSEKEPEPKGFDPDNYRVLLFDGTYSSLTYAQEANLNQKRSGVGLIFASEALGGARLEDAFNRFIPIGLPPGSKTEVKKIPSSIKTGASLDAWQEKYLKKRSGYESLVLFCRLQDIDLPVSEMVGAAINFTQRYSEQRNQCLRIIFILDPAIIWKWLNYPTHERISMENRADTATPLRRWSLQAVEQRLAQQGKLHSEEVCQDVLRVTGGWPWLLDELFKRCGVEEDDIRPFAVELDGELDDPGSAVFRDFREALGLDKGGDARNVLQFIAGEKGIPLELTEPEQFAEFTRGETGMSAAENEAGLLFIKHLGLVETRKDILVIEPVAERVLCKI